MRSRIVNPWIKRRRRSLQRFQAHRSGDIRDARKAFCPQQRKSTDCMHGLRSIQERQALFRLQGCGT